jgi:hypothetical protein
MGQVVLQESVCATIEFVQALLLMTLMAYSTDWAAAWIARLPVSRPRHFSPLWAFLSGTSNVVEVVLTLSQ